MDKFTLNLSIKTAKSVANDRFVFSGVQLSLIHENTLSTDAEVLGSVSHGQSTSRIIYESKTDDYQYRAYSLINLNQYKSIHSVNSFTPSTIISVFLRRFRSAYVCNEHPVHSTHKSRRRLQLQLRSRNMLSKAFMLFNSSFHCFNRLFIRNGFLESDEHITHTSR
jgi:hypothetical protein